MTLAWDKRRMVPRFSKHGSLTAADLDRVVAFPDIRVEREGSSIGISWEFLGELVDGTLTEDFTWAVERSGSSGGPFDRIAERLPVATRFFRDDNVPQGRENTQRLYYRLRLEAEDQEPIVYGYNPDWNHPGVGSKAHGVTYMGSGTRTEYAPALIREIRQRVDMLVNNAAGVPCYIYREAWTQPSCHLCVNPLSGAEYGGKDFCRSCLGTGFVGAFYSPMESSFVPVTQTAMLVSTPLGATDLQADHRVVMPYWPHVQPRDRIRLLDGTLYSVGSVDYPDLYGAPGLQMVVLSNIDRSDRLNQIPLPAGARERSRGPRRQRARAMNLKAYAKSLEEGGMHRATFFVTQEYQTDDR